MTGTEAIVPSARLSNREIRTLTGRRRLTFGARQLRANQRTVNRTLVRDRFVYVFVVFLIHRRGFVAWFVLLRGRGRSRDNFFVLDHWRAEFFRLV